VPPYQYIQDTILSNQVKYVCAAPGTIRGTGVTTEFCGPLAGPNGCPCELIVDSCVAPNAYCTTVTLESGTIVTFTYIVPNDGTGKVNTLVTQTLSSSTGPTSVTICARAQSITQIGGNGTLSFSSPGFIPCTTTADCNP
jgi:hypothetical protein